MINGIYELDNNEKYEIIESVLYENKVYVYLVNINDEVDSMFQELVKENDEYGFEDIEPNLFKDVIYNLFLDKFKNYRDIKLENIYKMHFEKYLSSITNLNNYDKAITSSELGFGDVLDIKLKSELDNLNNYAHFFVLNSFNTNKLSNEECNILENGSEDEILLLVKNTYKNVLTTNLNNDINNNQRYTMNYLNSTSDLGHAYNDELVIGLFYGTNKYKYNSKEAYLENYEAKKEFLNKLSNSLTNEIKSKLDISAKIIILKI